MWFSRVQEALRKLANILTYKEAFLRVVMF